MIVFAVFALVVFGILYPILFKKPTCSDGKQNGTETGIDCGGVCSAICKSDAVKPITVWSRAFPVTGNFYNLAAYIQNPNQEAAVRKANYEFRIYDTDNKLIGRRQGTTYIPPNGQFTVFESRFDAGKSKIRSVTFDFTGVLDWQKKKPILNTLPIKADSIVLDTNSNIPTLTARVRNDSVYDIPQFSIVAIVYDINNNAINVSKTIKSGIKSNSTTQVYFTWPESFIGTPIKSDVLVQINPFSVSF